LRNGPALRAALYWTRLHLGVERAGRLHTSMMIRQSLLLGLVVATAGCTERIGPLSPADSRLARADSARAFDAAAWRRGNPRERGAMLAALAHGPLALAQTASDVQSLLGPSECYVHYDSEPCYRLQLRGEGYRLEFPVNHSDGLGRIFAVQLGERGKPPRW
jgi:hypothetical protein